GGGGMARVLGGALACAARAPGGAELCAPCAEEWLPCEGGAPLPGKPYAAGAPTPGGLYVGEPACPPCTDGGGTTGARGGCAGGGAAGCSFDRSNDVRSQFSGITLLDDEDAAGAAGSTGGGVK